jgi:hypothetical protein
MPYNVSSCGAKRPTALTCYASFGLEGVVFWMLDGINSQVHIEIWPIEMAWRRLFNIKDLPNRNVFEPRKIIIGEEVLMVFGKQPKSVAGDISNLNSRRRNPMRR